MLCSSPDEDSERAPWAAGHWEELSRLPLSSLTLSIGLFAVYFRTLETLASVNQVSK